MKGYDSEKERELLKAIFVKYYRSMLRSVHLLVAEGTDVAFDLADEDAIAYLAQAGKRVVRIEEVTRAALAEALQEGTAAGEGPAALAKRIDHLFDETWKSRAMTVARTETRHAMVTAARDRYRASGVVSKVEIVDGTDHDDECRDRNGKVVSVDEEVDLNHPNCTLVLIPVVDRGA